MKALLPVRGQDAQGAGHYLAPRGNRLHKGIDFAGYPGTRVYPFYPGHVTKLGKPYEDDPDTPDINEFEAYDYVQVTDENGVDHQYLYVEPTVEVGDLVSTNSVIGTIQKLHFKDITHHCHYQVKKDGKYLNPEEFV